jgi:hypothetical protein
MLDGLFVTAAVTAILEALSSIPGAGDGPIAVVGNAKIARALAAKREVIPVGLTPRARKQFPGALDDASAIEPTSLAAVVAVDIVDDDAWQATLQTWTRVVRDGGAIVLVDRGHAPEASRRALCAGLTELEQRHAGRTVVTSGLVTHL